MKTLLEKLQTKVLLEKIAALIVSGVDVREAYDTVLGAGAYEKFTGEMWEQLQTAGPAK